MKNTLFIPKTITVGFQERSDTFTGKLGYVIYTDEKGVLRKETSWNNWRDTKLGQVTVNNDPTLGFNFNKGVKRDGHWGSGRSVIRVWDPRDFEFEISIDNLIGILMHADVSKRDITEPCVFAWYGTELILLPTNSIEYQESMKYTAKQSMKVSAKDLVPGYTYGTKKDQKSLVYLGYLERWDVKTVYPANMNDTNRYYSRPETGFQHSKKKTKSHMFIDPVSKLVENKDPSTHLASCEQEEVHPEFANLMTEYYKSAESQPVSGVKVSVGGTSQYYYDRWYDLGNNEFVELRISDNGYSQKPDKTTVSRFARFNPEISLIELSYESSARRYYGVEYPARTLPGLVDSIERVRQVCDQLDEHVQTTYVACKEAQQHHNKYDHRALSEMYQQRRSATYKSIGIGRLQYILADGKEANDHKH